MGLFFKKSKKLGLLRFNLSKSGIGLSFGIKGFRISKNSKGTQLNAGVNGLYFRKSLNGNNTDDNIETETIDNSDTFQQKTITIYQPPEVYKFGNIFTAQVLLTAFIPLILFLFGIRRLSIFVLLTGIFIILRFITKYPNERKAFFAQGREINELKNQNYKVEIKQGNSDTQSEDAIKRRNDSKYRNYKYSYENYKKD